MSPRRQSRNAELIRRPDLGADRNVARDEVEDRQLEARPPRPTHRECVRPLTRSARSTEFNLEGDRSCRLRRERRSEHDADPRGLERFLHNEQEPHADRDRSARRPTLKPGSEASCHGTKPKWTALPRKSRRERPGFASEAGSSSVREGHGARCTLRSPARSAGPRARSRCARRRGVRCTGYRAPRSPDGVRPCRLLAGISALPQLHGHERPRTRRACRS